MEDPPKPQVEKKPAGQVGSKVIKNAAEDRLKLLEEDISKTLMSYVPEISNKLYKKAKKREAKEQATIQAKVVFKRACSGCKSKVIRGYAYVRLFNEEEILCEKCFSLLQGTEPYVIVKKATDLPLYAIRDEAAIEAVETKKREAAEAKAAVLAKRKAAEEMKAKKQAEKKAKEQQKKEEQAVKQEEQLSQPAPAIEPVPQPKPEASQPSKPANEPEPISSSDNKDNSNHLQFSEIVDQEESIPELEKELIESMQLYISDEESEQKPDPAKEEGLTESFHDRMRAMIGKLKNVVIENEQLKKENKKPEDKPEPELTEEQAKLLERTKLIHKILCVPGVGPEHYSQFVNERMDMSIDDLVSRAFDHFAH